MEKVMKIGFIDYYLDEWHANNYPDLIKKSSNGRIEVAYAYGMIDGPDGRRTNKQWCEDMNIERIESMDEIIEKSDALVVLSPDNPEMHWEICQKPLRCGKRVYVDKTFAPSAKIAKDLFALADEYHTPMYSTSALRFSEEICALPDKKANFVLMNGPGFPSNYLIHQAEPLCKIMNAPVVRVMYNGNENAHSYLVEFEGKRFGSINMLWSDNFTTYIHYEDGTKAVMPQATNYFPRFIDNLVKFLETGEGKVPADQTIAIAALLETAHLAENTPGVWVDVK